jgi:hypothetical protein
MGLAARIRDIEFYSIESVVSGRRLGMTRRLCSFFCHVPYPLGTDEVYQFLYPSFSHNSSHASILSTHHDIL